MNKTIFPENISKYQKHSGKTFYFDVFPETLYLDVFRKVFPERFNV